MKNKVKINNLIFGEGKPKICVPIIGKKDIDILDEINELNNVEFDLVEWRVDFYEDCYSLEKVMSMLKLMKNTLKNVPILFTFRRIQEGGKREITLCNYKKLNKQIIESGNIDIVDVELFSGDNTVNEIVNTATQNNTKVIISNHDFNKTPAKEEIILRLSKMQELGGDFLKIAVTPHNTNDVLTLLECTSYFSTNIANTPIITIAMSSLGLISRLSGEIFGSAMTFGCVKSSSAPGQINANELNEVLNIIHNNSR